MDICINEMIAQIRWLVWKTIIVEKLLHNVHIEPVGVLSTRRRKDAMTEAEGLVVSRRGQLGRVEHARATAARVVAKVAAVEHDEPLSSLVVTRRRGPTDVESGRRAVVAHRTTLSILCERDSPQRNMAVWVCVFKTLLLLRWYR